VGKSFFFYAGIFSINKTIDDAQKYEIFLTIYQQTIDIYKNKVIM
jgi:hypothetical protein